MNKKLKVLGKFFDSAKGQICLEQSLKSIIETMHEVLLSHIDLNIVQ